MGILLEKDSSKESEEIKLVISEVSIFKQLIKERKEPLDLIRELLSENSFQILEQKK